MEGWGQAAAVWGSGFLLIFLIVLIRRRARRHGGATRAAAIGAMYELHSRDRQQALEIIAEGRAEERRLQHPDGNLPELESPQGYGAREPAAGADDDRQER